MIFIIKKAYLFKIGLLIKYTGNFLLFHTGLPCSTIGAIRLNFRVRNGIGCTPHAIATGKSVWIENIKYKIRV